jgi:hypothetical protein
MNQKETALRQIDEIYAVLQNNLKTIMPGKQLIAIGLGVMAIPFLEHFFTFTIDPFLTQLPHSSIIIFALRTLFYWTGFVFLSKHFEKPESQRNPLVEKGFDVGKFYPLIPLSVSAVLAISGYSQLISPMVLILVGVLMVIYGSLTNAIVTGGAITNIIGGLVGIWLSTLSIQHLWAYLVLFQGFIFVIIGFVLLRQQRSE